MQIHVTFYGVLKQDSGIKQQTVDLPGDAPTVQVLGETLAATYPAMAKRLQTVAFAERAVLVASDHVLEDGDLVALLPPVSGG